ncbi:MAG: hypothetical protein ACHREM_04625 [Polyangiales bacterium]
MTDQASPTPPKIRLSALAEALYQVRCARACLKVKELVKSHLEAAENACASALHGLGIEPGRTAEEADRIKLELLDVDIGQIPRPREVPDNRTPLELALARAATESGSQDEFRELGRFQTFCMRATFHGMVDDDPDLPVKVWLDARGRTSIGDLRDAAALFVKWQAEANASFRQQVMSGAPIGLTVGGTR